MARSKSPMSDDLKYEIAKELGIYDTIKQKGWGAVSSKDCGNIVKLAVERAQKDLSNITK